MRLAHLIQRYPPALGGSETYFARLSRYCAAQGDSVTVFTSNAVSLDAFWSSSGTTLPEGTAHEAGVAVRRYPLLRFPGRRWLLKALSLWPDRLWQCLTQPCNPISLPMWRDACGKDEGGRMKDENAPPSSFILHPSSFSFDAVHAAAFPYAFPIACGWRLARRLSVPFFITPFLHLGDPSNPHDQTRRQYTSPALRWLLREADGVFVQTPSEYAAVCSLGIPSDKVILQGLGVEPAECTGGYRADARQRWGLPDDAFVVGHLANSSWEKGTNDLLAALAHCLAADLGPRGPRPAAKHHMYLLLAGPAMPNFERYWSDFTQRHPSIAHERVRRLGPISDADKRDFFAAIDAFALPSRSDSFGLVLLEAWANGVPNIGYRAGGIADVIRHESDGLLVPCGDITGLAGALCRLRDDVRLRERLGQTGCARLPIEFRWQDKLELVRRTMSRQQAGNSRKQAAGSDSAEKVFSFERTI